MKKESRIFLAAVSLMLILGVSVLNALAAPGGKAANSLKGGAKPFAMSSPGAPSAVECTKLEVSDPALWFPVDENGDVDIEQPLDAYPAGTVALGAGFEYDCVPTTITVISILYYGGFDTEPLCSTKSTLKAKDNSGTFFFTASRDGGESLPDGQYQIEFYNKKKLLTQGEISIGGKSKQKAKEKEPGEDDNTIAEPGPQVAVNGLIRDQQTGTPIRGGFFLILMPGVTLGEWADNAYPQTYIYTSAKSNTQGKFWLNKKLTRGERYSTFGGAMGYQMIGQDDFVIGEDDPDPLQLTIDLQRGSPW
jgi:hypothetical protein